MPRRNAGEYKRVNGRTKQLVWGSNGGQDGGVGLGRETDLEGALLGSYKDTIESCFHLLLQLWHQLSIF